MTSLPKEVDNLSEYYTQKKQRIDLYLDMNTQKVVGLTKLTFVVKNEIADEIPEFLTLNLNAENINIISVKMQKNAKKDKDCNDGHRRGGRGRESKNLSINQNLLPLEFKNSSTNDYKNYLKELYENIEELESFKNINRVEWEIRQMGNLSIKIPKKYLIEKDGVINNNTSSNKNEDNSDINKNNNKIEEQNSFNENNNLTQKIKIIINYKLIEKNIGIIFQEFYESRTDTSYTICYTPNFYFNTQNWVPCIYKLNLQILWSLYLYIPDNYMAYTSCLLNHITKDANGKKLIISKCNEPTTARNIGFISLHDKLFIRYLDPSNKNFFIVGNESKKEKIEKNLINNKLIGTLYNYYDEFFDINEINIKSNLNTPTAIIFIPYLSINCPSQGFKKFLKLKEEYYFSFIKFPSLYILPEKFIYTQQVPEISKIQLRMLSKIFITNYIGGLIIEKTYADFWIINGLESWLSNLFLNKVFDSCYIKAKLYQYILKFKKLCKAGKETLPLYTNNFSHPIEMQLNHIFDLKSKIVLHLLEAQIEKIYIQKALKNIINERNKKGYNISTESLIKIFKKNCGINLKHFMDLYVYKTGMFEINLDYTYSQKTNSIDIKIHQEQIAKYYYEKHPYFYLENIDVDFLNKVGKNIQVIDYRTKPNRYFDIFFNLNILQTNGIEIMKDIHQIKLESDKENYSQNFPLISKIRKTDLKKREQEFIQDLIDNTGINKIYSNEQIENIFTKNSILWLRVDSELSSLHINKINQQDILYEYIKLFRDGDYVGQMESLYNVGKSEENYDKTLKILRTLIEYPNIYYKIRQYAIKIYIKILLKLKNEDEYQFLLDILDDCYNELLKNKTNLNLETYYVMKEVVKYLGEYKETNFKKFFTVGLVTNSTMQNKIIEKFLAILFSNELNTITGYDNCYIMADILISSSKLNLQEKSNYLLKKILKNLRIEKLKRSVNEITIISTLYALINLLIRNKFFMNNEKSKYNEILNEIFQEVNYYINNDTENYELRVFLEYFHIFMIFYKSQNYKEFSNDLLHFIFEDEEENVDNSTKDQSVNMYSSKKNYGMITKIKAMSYLFEDNILYFDTMEDKITFLSSLKTILFSPICYLRGDCRFIMEDLYERFFYQDITQKGINNGEKNLKGANFLNKMNANYANYSSKPYADDDWLYTFINEDRTSLESDEDENNDQDDMSNDTHKLGGINGINSQQIKKYKQKYKDDNYALSNLEVITDKPCNEILLDIIDKLWGHPLSEPFTYELNEETLGDLYQQYMDIIETPIDLDTIKNKILRNGYENFTSFNKDINLMFSNCRMFNERGSPLYIQGIHLEEYYKLISTPLKKIKLINPDYQPVNNKISIENNFENDKKSGSFNNINNKINIINDKKTMNTKNGNIMDEYDKSELNSHDNNKFLIPSSVIDLKDINDLSNNNKELLNKKEILSKNKNHNKDKKNKTNKNKGKKNISTTNNSSSFIINLDEKKE